MTFYVEKRLPLGAISFGVTPNGAAPPPDDDSALSTGPTGEFIRHRSGGFFFGGQDRFEGPALPEEPSVRTTPFWTSFKSESPRRTWGFIALMVFGFLFMLVGFQVIGRKGPQGWVEVILGAAMIATPIALTAQRRRKLREEEEWRRGEREATEKRNRELLFAYTEALEEARGERSDEAFARLGREQAALTLPREIWAPAARRTVLLIGFDELARSKTVASREIASLMDRAGTAAGLTPEERAAVKGDLARTIVWHLIADNRLGRAAALRNGFAVEEREIEQFRRVEGLSHETLPRAKCSTTLDFREYCIYETPTDHGTLHVTNRRLIVGDRIELPISWAADVVAKADENAVIIKTEDPRKPLRLRVEEPIYTAAILDMASAINERPRGFA